MKRFVTIYSILVFTFSLISTAGAVDFQEELKKLAEENAKMYIGPFSTAFGTAMNSELYHTAKPHGLLGFDISVKLAYVQIPDDALSFIFLMPSWSGTLPGYGNLALDGNILYPNRENPTVFGISDPDSFRTTSESVEAAARQALVGGGQMTDDQFDLLFGNYDWQAASDSIPNLPKLRGIDFAALPFVMPQVSVGLIRGTEVMLRFMPSVDLGDMGEINFLGIGIKHSISQYIPLCPVAISGQFVWQKLSIGDLLESKHTAFNIHASKTFGLGLTLTPYVGLGFESSTLDVSYTTEEPIGFPPNTIPAGTEISFSLDGENSFRALVGLRFALPLITLNVDYDIGEYSAISAGLGITLR